MNGEAFSPATLGVFLFFFGIVTVLGFVASRWRRGNLNQIDEWGLGGRRFGSFVTWFLLGGDLYTAYTLIAVPALVYAVGAYGFFAMPYVILVYPFVFLTMPRLWNVCRRHGWVTNADFVHGRYDSRTLALAVAVTGVLATMPYIALQLVGLEYIFKGMGLDAIGLGTETPLWIAFVVLALYTYSSGLRAPALIAFLKDGMLYVAIIAAAVYIPLHIGGFGEVFRRAENIFTARGHGGILLAPGQYWAFSTVALGSAAALFLYPHSATATLSASGPKVIRNNAIWLPFYTLILALISLLGYVALADGIHVDDNNMAVPALINASFPPWFVGFCFAAIALGALVPAAIMSIGAANLCTRNIWRPYINDNLTPQAEARIAKNLSLLIKFGALLAVLYLPTKYAIDLQLLGTIWILQIFPAVICGLFTRWFRGGALLAGWIAGMTIGSLYALTEGGVTPLHDVVFAGAHYNMYIGILALAANFAVALVANVIIKTVKRDEPADATAANDYADAEPGA